MRTRTKATGSIEEIPCTYLVEFFLKKMYGEMKESKVYSKEMQRENSILTFL